MTLMGTINRGNNTLRVVIELLVVFAFVWMFALVEMKIVAVIITGMMGIIHI